MSDLLFPQLVLAISGRDLIAYASIFFAVIGLVLFFKYLPRWMKAMKPKSPQVSDDPGAGLAAGMDLEAEMKKTIQSPLEPQVESYVGATLQQPRDSSRGGTIGLTPAKMETPRQDPLQPSILVLEKGIQHGPFNAAQVKEMMAGGVFSPDSLCWQPGQADWQPLKQVFGATG